MLERIISLFIREGEIQFYIMASELTAVSLFRLNLSQSIHNIRTVSEGIIFILSVYLSALVPFLDRALTTKHLCYSVKVSIRPTGFCGFGISITSKSVFKPRN